MSLDAYIAKSQGALSSSKVIARIEWFDHEALRSRGFFDRGGILMRLADFYKDAKIYTSELEQAISEVKRIQERCQDEEFEMLNQLADVFQQALEQQLVVFFIAD